MAAMIGADENAVRDLAAQADVDVANLNSPGQVVISGEASKVALAVSLASEHGIRRATMLKVAGAYHSRLMQSAYLKLGEELERTEIGMPKMPVICNVDARPVKEPGEIRESLKEQVTGTVRWTESLEYLLDREEVRVVYRAGTGWRAGGVIAADSEGYTGGINWGCGFARGRSREAKGIFRSPIWINPMTLHSLCRRSTTSPNTTVVQIASV